MITLRIINEDNFVDVIRLKVDDSQKDFIAPNVYSLAQAWLHYNKTKPFAIYYEETMVGFVLLDWDEDERTVGIWRFMIGKDFQNKGYGKASLIEIIKLIKSSVKFDMIHLSFVPGNEVAKHLYYSLGFRENGKLDVDEIIMTYPLTDNPKVGFRVADSDDVDEIYEYLVQLNNVEHNVSSELLSKDNIEKHVEEQKIVRYTIMGEMIGLSFNNEIFLLDKKYFDDILKFIKK